MRKNKFKLISLFIFYIITVNVSYPVPKEVENFANSVSDEIYKIRDRYDFYNKVLKDEEFIYIIHEERGKYCLLYDSKTKKIISFLGESQNQRISEFLKRYYTDENFDQDPLMLSKRIYGLVPFEEGGLIASPYSFSLMVSRPLNWGVGSIAGLKIEDLEDYNVEPLIKLNSGGEWCLKFRIFSAKGSINEWIIYGNESPFEIRCIHVEELLPAGSFRYPLDG